jgi:hypothetical protein
MKNFLMPVLLVTLERKHATTEMKELMLFASSSDGADREVGEDGSDSSVISTSWPAGGAESTSIPDSRGG